MAVLALGAVGGAVGWGIGGTATAALYGAQIGFAVGNLLFGGSSQTIQGPRIGDTAQQTAEEGNPRPWVFGIVRPIGGNLMASAELDKVIVRETQGGKGGGGGVTTEREELYRTYAVRVCEGPITRYRRIWRNGKLVYDAMGLDEDEEAIEQRFLSGGGSGSAPIILEDLNENSQKFLETATLYLGTFTQMPDPALEAAFGVGNVPPHRGTAYMVMEREDLTQEGGAIPQWKFEVEKCAVDLGIYAVDQDGGLMGLNSNDGNPVWITSLGKQAFDIDINEAGEYIAAVHWQNPATAYIVHPVNGNIIRSFTDSRFSGSFNHGCAIDNDGAVYIATFADGGGLRKYDFNGNFVWRFDATHADDGGLGYSTRVSGDYVYLGTFKRIIQLNRMTGAVNWTYTVPPNDHGSFETVMGMSVDADHSVYVCRSGVQFIKIDVGGTQRWIYDAKLAIEGTLDGSMWMPDFNEGHTSVTADGMTLLGNVGKRNLDGFINPDNTYMFVINAQTGSLISMNNDSLFKSDFLSDLAISPNGSLVVTSGNVGHSSLGAMIHGYNGLSSHRFSVPNQFSDGATLTGIRVK